MSELVRGVEGMRARAEALVKELAPTNHATIVTLSGELGAGKTTFVQGLARALGVEERVTSPSFVIEKIYLLPRGPFKKMVHVDADRLKSAHELEILGWNELVAEADTLVLLEWPERVLDIIPASAHRIVLTHVDENTRSFSYDSSQK